MTDRSDPPPEPAATLTLVNALLRHRRLMLLLPVSFAVVVVVVGLLLPRSYTANAWFAPQTNGGNLSRLSGLAAQFGLAVPSEDASNSPEFYADLLQSEQLLRSMVDTTYVYASGRDTVRATLVEVYGITDPDPSRAREKAVRRLGQHLQVSTDSKTGVVKLRINAPAADLAQDLVEHALDLVNAFNLRTRQSQAAAERKFVEGRMADAQRDLREAEDRLQGFLTSNRTYQNSPQLQFQHDRLERQVQMRQDVYTKLAQAFEQARIDEVRNTPVITIVEAPTRPVKPDGRRLALKALAALVFASVLGAAIALYRDAMARTSSNAPDQYAEFVRLRKALGQELRQPWTLFRF